MPLPGKDSEKGGARMRRYRASVIKLDLPRRDVHDLALIRRRLYELCTTPAFVQPIDLEFILSVVDSLYRRVDNARKAKGFTWNESAPEEDGLGEE